MNIVKVRDIAKELGRAGAFADRVAVHEFMHCPVFILPAKLRQMTDEEFHWARANLTSGQSGVPVVLPYKRFIIYWPATGAEDEEDSIYFVEGVTHAIPEDGRAMLRVVEHQHDRETREHYSVCVSYTGQSLYLPNWFVRRRGLAMSVAFSGVGVGSISLLPWLQTLIARAGWRAACWALAVLLKLAVPYFRTFP